MKEINFKITEEMINEIVTEECISLKDAIHMNTIPITNGNLSKSYKFIIQTLMDYLKYDEEVERFILEYLDKNHPNIFYFEDGENIIERLNKDLKR